MTTLPHDISDVMLAPVTLHIDRRLEALAQMDVAELAREVALSSNLPDDTEAHRRSALVTAVGYLTDLHGWELTWDPRGIRLRHAGSSNSFVLGVPDVVNRYVAGEG
jgi:hypothetical protein